MGWSITNPCHHRHASKVLVRSLSIICTTWATPSAISLLLTPSGISNVRLFMESDFPGGWGSTTSSIASSSSTMDFFAARTIRSAPWDCNKPKPVKNQHKQEISLVACIRKNSFFSYRGWENRQEGKIDRKAGTNSYMIINMNAPDHPGERPSDK